MQYREVRLDDIWRATHGNTPVPSEVFKLRSWECLCDSQQVGHCEGQCDTGEIIGLSVSRSHRRQGIGRKLLSLVVGSLRAAGVERVWVAASADSTVHDHRFYRAVGWEPTGQCVNGDDEVFEPRTDGWH